MYKATYRGGAHLKIEDCFHYDDLDKDVLIKTKKVTTRQIYKKKDNPSKITISIDIISHED